MQNFSKVSSSFPFRSSKVQRFPLRPLTGKWKSNSSIKIYECVDQNSGKFVYLTVVSYVFTVKYYSKYNAVLMFSALPVMPKGWRYYIVSSLRNVSPRADLQTSFVFLSRITVCSSICLLYTFGLFTILLHLWILSRIYTSRSQKGLPRWHLPEMPWFHLNDWNKIDNKVFCPF